MKNSLLSLFSTHFSIKNFKVINISFVSEIGTIEGWEVGELE